MQKLLKLLYSVLLGILVVIVTKLFLDSKEYGDLARHTDTLLNQSLLTVINNIRGDISVRDRGINKNRGDISIGGSGTALKKIRGFPEALGKSNIWLDFEVKVTIALI